MDTLTLFNTGALTVGTVGGLNGITAGTTTGTVNLSTNSGDLTVAQNISTNATNSSAITLNAGKTAAAGTATGGTIILSGSPTITTGTGGRATLYSGGITGSTGLAALVGAGHSRYDSDESATNFTTALGSGPYAIYRQQPSLTLTANADSKTYNGLAYSGGNDVSVGGFVNGDTNAILSGTVTYSGSAQGAINAGSYAITPGGLTNGLGSAITPVNGTLTVNQAPLTITAASQSVPYGAPVPSSDVLFSGFVNGETSVVLTTQPTVDATLTGYQNIGTYPGIYIPSGAAATNYNFTYVAGTLSVGSSIPEQVAILGGQASVQAAIFTPLPSPGAAQLPANNAGGLALIAVPAKDQFDLAALDAHPTFPGFLNVFVIDGGIALPHHHYTDF